MKSSNMVYEPVVLSHFQTQALIDAKKKQIKTMKGFINLGIELVNHIVNGSGVTIEDEIFVTWEKLEKINKSKNSCFVVDKNGNIKKIKTFSQKTNQLYSLMPTKRAPTMLISGFLMHRIKGTDPFQDTQEKIKAIKPIFGRTLDTATGLGYTAIEASKTANHVTTIEVDPAAQEIASQNPWSKELFNNDKIKQLIGDSFHIIKEFEDSSFSCVMHDPPAFNLAGQLYSLEFYNQLFRVMDKKGKLFHYIGNPKSPSGSKHTRGVIDRLRKAGFSKIVKRPSAFGLLVYK